MTALLLFWTFFKIGLFTIGGGHAMIPLIMREIVARGWLEEEVLLDFIAIAEGTPGPFAVNIATYTGMEVAGVGGAALATLGVVLPSLIIIILIVKLFSKYMQRAAVKEVFGGIGGAVTGLLASVAVTIGLSILFGISSVYDAGSGGVDIIGVCLFAALFVMASISYKGKKMPPLMIILISAAAGILLYGFIPS